MSMKKHLLIIFLLVPLRIYSEENPNVLFKEANEQFKDGKYENAIQLYKQISSNGYESALLYYNIGDAYYRLRQYPKAILNYERSLLFDPGNNTTRYNLAKARMYNIDKIDEIPEIIIKRWLFKLISIFHSNSWAILSILSFLIVLSLLLMYFLTVNISIKKASFYCALILLLISTISFYFSYKAKDSIVNRNGAIVMSATVTVRSSPQVTGTDIFIIHEGTKVYIVGKLDIWDEIRLTDGKQGWLLASDIEAI
jgi:tetratricopeptide (TPR) repeat protein